MSKLVKKTKKTSKVKKVKVKKTTSKKVVKPKTKKIVKKATLGYTKKILNPRTNRYVNLESRLGKSITDHLNKLLKQKKRTKAEQDYVDKILFSKFCKCTKSLIISESKKKCPPCPDKKLPYAVCTYNIYNRRGLRIKPNASRLCRKTFKWYN